MEKNNKQILYLVLLIVVFVVLVILIYVGALGMQRGIYGTKLSMSNYESRIMNYE
ncbi:MAG: hypothetical protein NTZ65_00260 [Candidatus Berkelbacteria bacterium]|nr:hypothetical protein [Candidatus Berkelbacteria bacterium]